MSGDELLVLRCQLGEREAFRELVHFWHAPLWRYVRGMVGSPHLADDLSPAYHASETSVEAAGAVVDNDSLSDVLTTMQVEAGLNGLPPLEREVLILFHLQDLPLTACAEVLGVPPGTVKSRLHRARRMLRSAPADCEVSLGSRMRHVAVGLAGGSAAALIAVLWVTEPHPLAARTQAAFTGLIAIGLAWAAFAGWMLSMRQPLFARDRVLGAWLALVVTVVTGVAGTALAAARGTTAEALATALVGVTLVAAAGLVLARAWARRRELLRLRDALRRDTA